MDIEKISDFYTKNNEKSELFLPSSYNIPNE